MANLTDDPVPLCVDAKRLGACEDDTSIFVRAKLPDGSFGSVNIAELTRASLHQWLRSRGGKNLWAENCVLAMLGHEGITEEDGRG